MAANEEETKVFLFSPRPLGQAHAATERSNTAIDATKLAARIRDGDPASISEFYQVVQGGIRLLLRHHLQAQASEVEVQAVSSAAVEAIQCGELRDPEHLWVFVRTVVRAKIKEHGCHSPVQGESLHLASTQATAREEDAHRLQQAEVMRKVLLELSPPDREVLRRFYVLNQPEGEICRATGFTLAELRGLRSKARTRFRRLENRGLRKNQPGDEGPHAAARRQAQRKSA